MKSHQITFFRKIQNRIYKKTTRKIELLCTIHYEKLVRVQVALVKVKGPEVIYHIFAIMCREDRKFSSWWWRAICHFDRWLGRW